MNKPGQQGTGGGQGTFGGGSAGTQTGGGQAGSQTGQGAGTAPASEKGHRPDDDTDKKPGSGM